MKNITKFLAILLLIVMALLIALSGTYAKYASEIAGSDSAVVAKWEIVIDEGANGTTTLGVTTDTFKSFSLFDTILDSNDAEEGDVSAGEIAPGTQGAFSFTIQNKSEVTAEYSIDYTVTNASGIPIEYSIDGTNWTSDLNDVEKTTLAIGSSAQTVKVMWRWAFTGADSSNFTSSQTDVTDTTLGIAGTAPTITVDAELIVEQVD